METKIIYKPIKVKPIGEDFWGNKLFENVETKRVYAEVDGVLHTTTKEGEPDSPLRNKIEVLK